MHIRDIPSQSLLDLQPASLPRNDLADCNLPTLAANIYSSTMSSIKARCKEPYIPVVEEAVRVMLLQDEGCSLKRLYLRACRFYGRALKAKG